MKQKFSLKNSKIFRSQKNALVPRFYIAVILFIVSIFMFIDGVRKPEYNEYLENQHRVITPRDYDLLFEGEDVKGSISKDDVVDYFTIYDDNAAENDVGYLAVITPGNRIMFFTADASYTEKMYNDMKKMMSGDEDSPDHYDFEGLTLKSELLDRDINEFIEKHIPEEKLKSLGLTSEKSTICYICGFKSEEPYSKAEIAFPFICGGLLLALAVFMLTKPADMLAYHVIRLWNKIRKKPEPEDYVLSEEYKGSKNDPLTRFTPEQEQAEKTEEQKEDKE